MHESLRLYAACLTLISQETQALDNEDEARLEELCSERIALMEKAWEKREGCDPALLAEQLKAIQYAQEELTAKTRMRTETLRMTLQNSRKESTRLAGYGKIVGNGQNQSLLRKEG